MNKTEYKNRLLEILNEDVDGMDFDEKMTIASNVVIDLEIKNYELRDTPNKGKPWQDEELKIILADAPTRLNCLKYAKIFKRGYGSIEQIYRWATTPKKYMSDARKKDAFIEQIKKVAKSIEFKG